MDWPYTLLPIPFEAHELALRSNCVRTEMESGFVRQRKRFDTQTRHYAVKWVLTETQMALFQSFVKHKLQNGAASFNMDMKQGDGGITAAGEMRFVGGDYKASHSNSSWRVSATLEVLNARPSTEIVFDDIVLLVNEGFALEDVLGWPGPLHTLVHSDLPTLNPAP